MPAFKSKEFHLFYEACSDEIQIESYDKKHNKDILKLAVSVPDAVTILDADDARFIFAPPSKQKMSACVSSLCCLSPHEKYAPKTDGSTQLI